jgi:hypothetical protein
MKLNILLLAAFTLLNLNLNAQKPPSTQEKEKNCRLTIK